MVVTLTHSEVLLAAQLGVMRRVADMKAGRKAAHGADNSQHGWQLDIEGACGEMALAKALGLYWSGALNNLKADDVGRYQVRTTTVRSGRLILHPGDPDDRAFVLIIGAAPRYYLAGWIYARDGKLDRLWCDPRGDGRHAYFVPQDELHPIHTLPQEGKTMSQPNDSTTNVMGAR